MIESEIIIDKSLLECGVNEYIINYLHSKSKLSFEKVTEPSLLKNENGNLTIRVELRKRGLNKRKLTYHTSISEIRKIKLDILLN